VIGIEGFPHSGFRHFMRYVNIRGIVPGQQEDTVEERAGEGHKGKGECL